MREFSCKGGERKKSVERKNPELYVNEARRQLQLAANDRAAAVSNNKTITTTFQSKKRG